MLCCQHDNVMISLKTQTLLSSLQEPFIRMTVGHTLCDAFDVKF